MERESQACSKRSKTWIRPLIGPSHTGSASHLALALQGAYFNLALRHCSPSRETHARDFHQKGEKEGRRRATVAQSTHDRISKDLPSMVVGAASLSTFADTGNEQQAVFANGLGAF